MPPLRQSGGEIEAEVIKRAIDQQCDIDLSNKVRVIGNLILADAQSLTMPAELKIIVSKIVVDCLFMGKVNFSNVRFRQDVSFAGSCFNDEVRFCPAEFEGKADFSFTHFKTSVDFSSVKFGNDVTFKQAGFFKTGSTIIDFSNTYFEKDLDFSYVNIVDENESEDCEDEDPKIQTRFMGTRFKGIASFTGSHFHCVYFGDAFFYDLAEFDYCNFQKSADFRDIACNRDIIFKSAKFKRKLLLNGARFNHVIIRWETIKNCLPNADDIKTHSALEEYKEAETIKEETLYLSLVKSFAELGLFQDADNCYLQYRSRKGKRYKGNWRDYPIISVGIAMDTVSISFNHLKQSSM